MNDCIQKIVCIVGIILLTIIGCDKNEVKQDEKLIVALVMKTLNNPFFIDMEKGAEEAAEKLGVE